MGRYRRKRTAKGKLDHKKATRLKRRKKDIDQIQDEIKIVERKGLKLPFDPVRPSPCACAPVPRLLPDRSDARSLGLRVGSPRPGSILLCCLFALLYQRKHAVESQQDQGPQEACQAAQGAAVHAKGGRGCGWNGFVKQLMLLFHRLVDAHL